jgi:hypothetical protein
VLRYDHRWNLEGEEVSDVVIEDAAREQAHKQLTKIMTTHWTGRAMAP